MIDFCSEGIETKISTNSLSADYYEVTNLLKNVQQPYKTKGFQAERFVKCPTSVIVKFPLKVNLHEIILKPWIGGQCAQIIHLYVLNSPRHRPGVEVKDEEIRYQAATVNLASPSTIKFNTTQSTNHQASQQPLEYKINSRCQAVIGIKITIARMLKGSIPSIAHLTIKGTPSAHNSPDIANKFLEKWTQLTRPPPPPPPPPQTTAAASYEPLTAVTTTTNKSRGDEIPELYTDSLTFTMMSIPVLLPCGKHVDQTTLEKYLAAQETQGRTPCDPFTGIRFDSHYRPVVDTELKFKIDHYRLKRKTSSEDHDDVRLKQVRIGEGFSSIEMHCSTCRKYLNVSDPSPKYKLLTCGHKLCARCCTPDSITSSTIIHHCKHCNIPYTRSSVVRVHGLR